MLWFLFPSLNVATGIWPWLTLASLAVEAAAGYPNALYRRVRHPVVWLGRLIAALDAALNRPSWPPPRRRLTGVAAVLILLAVSGGAGIAVQTVAARLPGGFVLAVLAAASLPAQRSLHRHVAAVANGLRQDGLAGGRRAVAHIVGRDPDSLDEAGIARAAIESLAENFSDGVVAPVFWLAVAGLPGALIYKAVNTADSMIGHLTPRHAAFGWAAARLDDLINLPASRLTALLLALASGRPGACWRAVRRDAPRHRSPNAGWPEAAMAAALGLALAGPRIYGAVRVDDAWMGDGTPQATADDIRRGLRVYRRALGLLWALALLLALAAGRG